MVELIDAIKAIPQLGVDTMLILLVYLLAREVKAQKKMLIDCLQSGGKIDPQDIDKEGNLL